MERERGKGKDGDAVVFVCQSEREKQIGSNIRRSELEENQKCPD